MATARGFHAGSSEGVPCAAPTEPGTGTCPVRYVLLVSGVRCATDSDQQHLVYTTRHTFYLQTCSGEPAERMATVKVLATIYRLLQHAATSGIASPPWLKPGALAERFSVGQAGGGRATVVQTPRESERAMPAAHAEKGAD
jgi:hypothetical protein